MNDQAKFEQLLKKIEEMKTKGGVDLSTEEDLSVAIMNLVSLEEHFFFTAEKTGKDEYLDMMMEVREMRKKLLARMMGKNEGETWCISKHLLATAMRLIEVGTKLQADKKTKDAKETFVMAYKIYSLFWALRFNLIKIDSVKKLDERKPWKVEDLVNQLVDCCKE